MAYVSLYRKYRSQDFNSIVGQEHVVQILKNAINAERLAHAYIFAGPRGTGKTSLARILAKALNCRQGVSAAPCLTCDLCHSIKSGIAMDVIEIDAASNRGIDEIRQLREQVNFVPAEGKYKIYIIDEVHMLTNEAFNALLKTLEEPPQFTVFVLATTEIQKIPATILSRCQRLDFKRITADKMAAHLKWIADQEQIVVDEKTLNYIARISDGGMRDAISLFDQLISFKGKQINFDNVMELLGSSDLTAVSKLGELLAKGDSAKLLECLVELIAVGKNIIQINKDLLEYFRNILFAKIGADKAIELSSDNISFLKAQAEQFSAKQINDILLIFSKADAAMKWQQNSRLILELALIEASLIKRDQAVVSEKEQKIITPLITKKEPNTARPQVTLKNDFIKKEPVVEPDTVNSAPLKNCNFADIKVLWPEVMHKVKLTKPMLNVLLCESEPYALQEDLFVLKFKDNYGFHRDKLMNESNKLLLEKILTEMCGKSLTLNALLEKEIELEENKKKIDLKTEESEIGLLTPQKNIEPVENNDSAPEKDLQAEKLVELFNGKIIKN